jgi:hydroxymethylpyrimidine kinase/phosphomethylpyrimidine kinase
VQSVDDAIRASRALIELKVKNVLIKGGDTRFSESDYKLFDVLNANGKIHVFERKLVGSRNSHGTGCAMAAAICSRLALGSPIEEAVDLAGRFVGSALEHAYPTGKGSGSINHMWNVSIKQMIDDNPVTGIS